MFWKVDTPNTSAMVKIRLSTTWKEFCSLLFDAIIARELQARRRRIELKRSSLKGENSWPFRSKWNLKIVKKKCNRCMHISNHLDLVWLDSHTKSGKKQSSIFASYFQFPLRSSRTIFLSVAKKNAVNHVCTLNQIFGTKKYLVTFWNR